LNEKVTNAIDKLLGVNSSAIISLGTACGGLIYLGVLVGGLFDRLDDIERRSVRAEICASVEQFESVKQLLDDLQYRTAKLEWKTGVTP